MEPRKLDEVEEVIYQNLLESYQAKMKELPPPPPGYYYRPELANTRREGDKYIIDVDLILTPIVTIPEDGR